MKEIPGSLTAVTLTSYQLGEDSKYNITNDIESSDEATFINNNEFNNIFSQYKTVLLNSLVTAFGLDQIIFNDKDGGNVQTIHNAKNHVYANEDFSKKGERKYDRNDYATANYMNKRRKKDFQTNDKIHDGYTGKVLNKDGRTDLEHIVSAKENHERLEMRLFHEKAEMSDLINSKKNTTYIDSSTNKSKGARTLKDWGKKTSNNDKTKTNEEYYGVDSKKAYLADENARRSIDEKVARRKLEHYSSSMMKDSLNQGSKMAIRQGLGIVFSEIASTIMDNVPGIIKEIRANFSIELFLEKIGELIVLTFERVKSKMSNILDAVKTGFTSGVFSSIVTSVINMFATMAKNIVRLVRQGMVSITEAVKIIFFDTENRTTGEKVIAASKVIMTGASVVLGVLLEQSISSSLESSGIGSIPVIGGILTDIFPIFIGTLFTGLLSVTFLYFMDNNKSIQNLISFIDKVSKDCFDRSIDTINQANALLDNYIAELCKIDIEKLKEQISDIHEINLAVARRDNDKLYKYCGEVGIKLQFNNTQQFTKLMLSEDSLEI